MQLVRAFSGRNNPFLLWNEESFLSAVSQVRRYYFQSITIDSVQNALDRRDIVHAVSTSVGVDACVSALQFTRFIYSLFLLLIDGRRACNVI